MMRFISPDIWTRNSSKNARCFCDANQSQVQAVAIESIISSCYNRLDVAIAEREQHMIWSWRIHTELAVVPYQPRI